MAKIEIEQGYICYEVPKHGENMEITEIFVKPEFRRQGVGSSLLKKVERIASDRSFACIYLFTRESNEGAQKFYEKNGYEKVCTIKGFYRSEGGVMYIKRL